MPKQESTMIPLLCDLCPKKPRFSDVSHLLTHISSKSHLSNRFKLQIRSQGEPEARKLLEDFDAWYSSYGLEDLLSDRLTAKEQKRATKRTRVQPAPTKSSRKAVTKDETKAEVKTEMKAEVPAEQPLAATPIYRPPIPRMHSWSTDPYGAEFTALPTGSPWILSTAYETPTMKRSIPNFTQSESPAPSSTQLAPTPFKTNDADDEGGKEGSRLKGIYWPGMNLFDSATAEMKRMRNQKKDGTALQQMKRSSAGIEPTEWVFNADGGFRKVRDIFDDSTESSSEKSVVAPSPKKKRTRKGVLADISINAPRPRTSVTKQVSKKGPTKRKTATLDQPEDAPKGKGKANRGGLSTYTQFSPSAEEREEFRLTVGDLGKKPKFGIFRDADDSPARTESPLEDHRFEFSAGRTVTPSKSGGVSQNSPTPLFNPIPMRFGTEDDFLPASMNRQLMSASSNGLNPNIFHSDTMNPLYTHAHAHTFSYGARQIFQNDFKPSYSSFGGDFKPLMTTDSFRRTSESHRLASIPGPSMADNIRYGM